MFIMLPDNTMHHLTALSCESSTAAQQTTPTQPFILSGSINE